MGTDGNVMVWSQSSGAVPTGAPGVVWQENDLMIAPYTTDPGKLAPKKLRSLPGPRSSCVRWKVQAGYAGSYELFDPTAGPWYSHDAVLVRLSDGVMWRVPRRSGRIFRAPLYITPTEIALEEGLTLPNDAGVTEFESWSIVRYPIAPWAQATRPGTRRSRNQKGNGRRWAHPSYQPSAISHRLSAISHQSSRCSNARASSRTAATRASPTTASRSASPPSPPSPLPRSPATCRPAPRRASARPSDFRATAAAARCQACPRGSAGSRCTPPPQLPPTMPAREKLSANTSFALLSPNSA